MNRYLFIRRLMGPCILLLLGIIALLHQAHIVHWSLFVPLLLILIGVLKLAERAALASEGYPPPPYPWGTYPGAPNPPAPGAASPNPPAAETNTNSLSIHDYRDDTGGGQS
jgi:hypothetical protein